MNLKGSQTEKNLEQAFSGESMARNKYLFFAEKAKQEGHPEISELFERMARNEGVHGKLLYQKLHGGIADTNANLKDAMEGEYGEWTSMYPEFAKKAREEGFEDIAVLFEKIADIEKTHEHEFLTALAGLVKSQKKTASGGEVPSLEENVSKDITVNGYRCMFCGATFEKRPDVCNVCGAIGSFEDAKITKKVN